MSRDIDFGAEWDDLPVGCIESHFFDSGSFTLRTKAHAWAAEKKGRKWRDYYRTAEFDAYVYEYMDRYAAFVKKYSVAIDYYANVDVIPDPILTYRNQKYLEDKHGLKPVPVVHYGTDLKWLRKYIKEGYDLIGIGGLVGSFGSSGREPVFLWLDQVFNLVCDNPKRLPCVRLHGFGATLYELLIRYPWWSVDSTTWTKIAAYGGIFVPHLRKGKWDFAERPYNLQVSMESPSRSKRGKHYWTNPPAVQAIVRKWLDHIGIPLGAVDPDGQIAEFGVITRHTERRAANLHFFEGLRKWLPEYPWPFSHTAGLQREGFGL